MEVLVEAAGEVPQGCFVAVRLGENLKQRRFNKSTAKYYFPLPQEKGKARIDVYQLVGTCSVHVDPAANGTEEVNAISGDSSESVKLRVSTCNRDLKPEDAAKQRREIEAETKDAATGYLQKHGIEDKLAECLRTMLRMKPEDPVEFMCKFLRGGDPEEPPAPVAPAPVEAAAVPVAPAAPKTEMVEETKPEVPAAPPAPPVEENRPQVKPEAPAEQAVTVETPKPVESQPEAPVQPVRSSPAARAALMNSVRQGDLISALEEEDTMNVPFALRPSVGTWLMPLSVEKEPGPQEAAPMTYRRGSTEAVPEVAVGNWLCAQNGSFNLKGLGKTPTECCEVERLLTKALIEMDGELQGDYFAMGTTHPLSPGGLGASEKAALESKKLMFESKDLSGRGVYLTEKEDLALWINAEKHLQILVHSSAKQNLAHKIDMMVSALQGPLLQDGYTLSP